ncbi:hypothetical protein F5888DRAFT_1648593 [Russula emetica]|nr:hypothetical protein F5888DRAFT_1648593 [Russula emetica]
MYTRIELSWRAFLFFFFFLFHTNRAPRGTELYVAQLPVFEYNLNYGDNALSEPTEPCDDSRGTAPITNKAIVADSTVESEILCRSTVKRCQLATSFPDVDRDVQLRLAEIFNIDPE